MQKSLENPPASHYPVSSFPKLLNGNLGKAAYANDNSHCKGSPCPGDNKDGDRESSTLVSCDCLEYFVKIQLK